VIRLTPKGLSVRRRVSQICYSRRSPGMFPPARQAKPPALDTAPTRSGVLTHVIAPQMNGYLTPRNSRPHAETLSRSSVSTLASFHTGLYQRVPLQSSKFLLHGLFHGSPEGIHPWVFKRFTFPVLGNPETFIPGKEFPDCLSRYPGTTQG